MNATKKTRVTQITEHRPTHRVIPIDKLFVDYEVQRQPPSKKLVKEIADNLDLSAIGVLHVSERDDGTFHVMDGQRRMMALRMCGMDAYRANCLVYSGMSKRQEAAQFRRLNNQRIVGAFDDFDKAVREGSARECGITALMSKHQWTVGRLPSPGVASCVTALRKVWDHDGNGALLNRSVSVLVKAFGRDKHTMAGSLVKGMGSFLSRDGVDEVALTEKLVSKFHSPVVLVGQARARMQSEGGTLSQNVCDVIGRTYGNRKKPTR